MLGCGSEVIDEVSSAPSAPYWEATTAVSAKEMLTKARTATSFWTARFSARMPCKKNTKPRRVKAALQLSLYKILFHFKALLWESIILLLLPPQLQNLPYCNTIARPLRNKRLLPDPPLVSHTYNSV